MPAFKERLVREGTPAAVYRYPSEVLADPEHMRRATSLTVCTTSPSDSSRKRKPPLSRTERQAAGRKAFDTLDRLFQDTDTGRLRYWAG